MTEIYRIAMRHALIWLVCCLQAACAENIDRSAVALSDPFSDRVEHTGDTRRDLFHVVVPSLTEPTTLAVWTVRPKGETTPKITRARELGIRGLEDLVDTNRTYSVWRAVTALRDSDRLILTSEESLLASVTGVLSLVTLPVEIPLGLPSVSSISAMGDAAQVWACPEVRCPAENVDASVRLICGILDTVSRTTGRNVCLAAPAVFCSNGGVLALQPSILDLKFATPSEVLRAQGHVGKLLEAFREASPDVSSASAIARVWERLLAFPGVIDGHAKVLYVDLKRNMVLIKAKEDFGGQLDGALRFN